MNVQLRSGFFDKTLRNLRNGWRSLAGSDYDASSAGNRPALPDDDLETLRRQMTDCLEGKGGAVSARSRAAALGHVYLALDAVGRGRFLHLMADDFGVNDAAVDLAIGNYRRATTDEKKRQAELNLRRSLEAPRVNLLRQFNALPDGTKFLVDLRAELLVMARDAPELRGLEADLKALLESWFDVDFLELRQIAWNTASAALLERLIAYEAVHAIASWDDLKNRLDSDRRCFAFFHPRMPDEPLIFVEVALVNGLAGNVQALLDEGAPVQNPDKMDTAIFYSISNAQKGLAGISFGNFLIKRVVDQLSKEFKGLKTFATLSPVPGFVKWLDQALADGAPKLMTAAEKKALNGAVGKTGGGKGTLRTLISDCGWVEDEITANALRAPLERLCLRYLVDEKGRHGRALDPVAHFHQTNGAILGRLHWLADSSENGLRQSAGMMVNYLYELDRIDANHETYTGTGKVNVASDLKAKTKS